MYILHHSLEALVGIFDQIMGEDDGVREKAIAYVSVPLMAMKHKIFIPNPDNEKFLVECIKKVSTCTCCIVC